MYSLGKEEQNLLELLFMKLNSSKSLIFSNNFKLLYIGVNLVTWVSPPAKQSNQIWGYFAITSLLNQNLIKVLWSVFISASYIECLHIQIHFHSYYSCISSYLIVFTYMLYINLRLSSPGYSKFHSFSHYSK